MHEMGIALEIIDIARASIPADMPDATVARVNLKVGKLSAVVPESLRFCFGVAAKDTPLSGADLHIEEVPVTIRCDACQHERVVSEPVFSCRACGSGKVTLLSGKELDIISIELAQEDD
jgi:hydrogenase nickel incorporation protein HypA/HybF